MRTVEVTDELQAYLDGLVPKRDQVLARMEEEAHRENIPIVDPHEGMLLYLLVKIAGAKRVLELGTATGYSGIWLLRGTDGGSLTTFEVDHKRAERARANFSDAVPPPPTDVDNARWPAWKRSIRGLTPASSICSTAFHPRT